MEIVIDIEDSQPPFAQLMQQIRQAVSSGELDPGDPLPSIRQLAGDLELNSKTVAKAYRLLERDAVVQSRGYRGTFIHPEARDNCAVDLNAWVLGRLREAVAAFRESGVTDTEIRAAFSTAMSQRTATQRRHESAEGG